MGNLYAIQGENQTALIKANFKQLHQYLTTDSNWANRVAEIAENSALVISALKFNAAFSGSNVVEQGNNYFVVRGSQHFFYRIDAVNATTSRITPEGRIWGYLKFAIPFGLFMSCIFPVVLTPLIFSLRKKASLNQSRHYLDPFCRYLEMRLTQTWQPMKGEIKQ